jgi:hypothetical protein
MANETSVHGSVIENLYAMANLSILVDVLWILALVTSAAVIHSNRWLVTLKPHVKVHRCAISALLKMSGKPVNHTTIASRCGSS